MKVALILGIIALISAFGLSYSGNRYLTSLSKKGEYTVDALVIIGFLLIGISSIMYLDKNKA